jgi:NADPH:quinone reductase-like Zn-dependent oxidoreductase
MVEKATDGRMADVVVDPLGERTWSVSVSLLGRGGRWVTFGQLTGGEVKIQLSLLYSNQFKLIGSTGGTRRELLELVNIMGKLKVKVDKYYELSEAREALTRLFSTQRNGRIMIKISV